MLETWRITKSRHTCCLCGEEFAENGLFFSCLVEQEAEFGRRDFCRACWEESRSGEPVPGRLEGLFCFWRTRRAPASRRQVVDTDLMLEFFDRLERPDSDMKRTLRFVLALYLMRRKELKLVEVSRGGTESLVLERRSSGDRVEVENPNLTEEQIEQTAAQLSQLLSAGL